MSPVLAVCCFLLGALCQKSGLATTRDGEAALNLASQVTLPAFLLFSMASLTTSWKTCGAFASCAMLSSVITAVMIWWRSCNRSRTDTLPAVAMSTLLVVPAVTTPVANAILGVDGVQLAVVWHLVTWATGCLCLWVTTRGSPTATGYKHKDGGTYSGQWMGLQKSGVGIYSYPSAASYAGQWINNVKDGYGTYKFPKGGLYKGQWLDGVMDGLGVRVFTNGKVQGGLWRCGQLVSKLPLSRCSAAAHAASDAAQAAASHMASGDRSAVLSKLVLAQPAIWVTMASLAVSCTQSTIPPSILTAANALSILHAPLAFLAMGICVGAPSLSNVQHSAASSLAVCHLPALLTSAALILAQQPVMAAAALLFSLEPLGEELPVVAQTLGSITEPEPALRQSRATSMLLIGAIGSVLQCIRPLQQAIWISLALGLLFLAAWAALNARHSRATQKMVYAVPQSDGTAVLAVQSTALSDDGTAQQMQSTPDDNGTMQDGASSGGWERGDDLGTQQASPAAEAVGHTHPALRSRAEHRRLQSRGNNYLRRRLPVHQWHVPTFNRTATQSVCVC